MKTLITVDLDYWTNCYKNTNKEGISLLKEIRKASSKSYIVWWHHHILDIIPRRTKRIINIDFHNDIVGEELDVDEDPDCLNEGTWGNFLPKSVESFEWYFPSYKQCIQEAQGLCLSGNGEVTTDYPVNYKQQRNWKSMDFESAHTFVLCVSPHWANNHNYEDYLNALEIDSSENEYIGKI